MGKGWHRGGRRRGLWVLPPGRPAAKGRVSALHARQLPGAELSGRRGAAPMSGVAAAAGAAAAPTGVVIMSPARVAGRWRRRRHPPHQQGGGSPHVVEGLLVPQGQLIRQQEAQLY